ncbi:putative urate catabolism protein [Hartmannibacter diazotrophicus]|uniref:Chitooligosaccharide deacetylase n=1 Tax=Hartmannibacter diazotrophicus TaxID=1482074 RepID=A0A2C9D1F0_9HYPH|nr:polysaccharide deacetylase family protein [Hartmannibacter diazotrophicus]SON54053.1 putative urate catabolism protein [Hartmannibacter diazotrophicus]
MTGPYGPFKYSAINRRPPFRFRNDARVAVWVIPNIEFFPLTKAIPTANTLKIPDVPSWSRRDYGNRVGIFRLFEVMDRYGIRGTAALNSDICDYHPEIVEECRSRDWEFIGHCESNAVRLNEVPPEEEPKLIQRTLDAIEQAVGKRPKGWLGAGLQESWDTLGHLAAADVDYVADWCNDDQPYLMQIGERRLASVPYSFEINDKGAYETLHQSPGDFADMIIRQFDVLYREGEVQARVLPIALHPYISGVAHRIDAVDRALEHICRHDGVWLATGAEIAEAARPL